MKCQVYYYPKLKDHDEDAVSYSAYQYMGKTYSVEDFEHKCKMKAFW